MFYLYLSILAIIVMVSISVYRKINKKNYHDDTAWYMVSSFVLIISLAIFTICIISGINDYPKLRSTHIEIVSLKENISIIKNARYKLSKSSEVTIAGSLDNMKQSTNLSNYLSDLSKKEAKYLYDLENSKIHRTTLILWFFKDGAFISDKINELPTTFNK